MLDYVNPVMLKCKPVENGSEDQFDRNWWFPKELFEAPECI